MAYVDKALSLCRDQDFFGSAGTALIGDSLDLGTKINENLFGGPMPMVLVVRVTQAMTGGTSARFRLRTGTAVTNGNISTGGATIMETQVITRANLPVGAEFMQMLPYGSVIPDYKRYLQMDVTRVGTSTAGEIDAYLTPGEDIWEAIKSERAMIV